MKSIKQKCRHFKSDFLQKYDNFDKAAKRGTGLSDVCACFSKYISKYVFLLSIGCMIVFGGNGLIEEMVMDNSMTTPKWAKLNFMNIVQLGENLNLFPPGQMLQFMNGINNGIETVEFDRLYAEYLLGDNVAFVNFMKILMAEYFHTQVFVLYDDTNPVIEGLVESIIKLIQARYGTNPVVVHAPEDLYFLPDEEGMSRDGVQTFMGDKERFTLLTTDFNNLDKNTYAQEEKMGGCI